MPKCPKCDTQVSVQALNCPECGVKFRRRAASPLTDDELDDLLEDDQDGFSHSRKRRHSTTTKSGIGTWVVVLIVLAAVPLLMCPILIALLLPAVQQARSAARNAQAMNHLKQLALASHNFYDTFQHFPPYLVATSPPEPGRVPQSWMTDILPYIEQSALYSSIQLNTDWNDPANLPAMSTVVPIYLHPELKQLTNAQGYALAHFAANSQVMSDQRQLRIPDIVDGTANTMLAGSVNDGLKPWGDPSNHRDPALGFQGGPTAFGAPTRAPRRALVLLCDGSVRNVAADLAPEFCRALATPNGLETVRGDF